MTAESYQYHHNNHHYSIHAAPIPSYGANLINLDDDQMETSTSSTPELLEFHDILYNEEDEICGDIDVEKLRISARRGIPVCHPSCLDI